MKYPFLFLRRIPPLLITRRGRGKYSANLDGDVKIYSLPPYLFRPYLDVDTVG